MRNLPELPDEFVAGYWQAVRDLLVDGGRSLEEAERDVDAYREFMKPASWTIYNSSPEKSAAMAVKYAAWMAKEAAKPKAKRSPVTSKRKHPPGK